jgi:hypothetical protein
MATQQGKILLLAGAGALLFMSAGKKKRRKPSSKTSGSVEEDLDKGDEPILEDEDVSAAEPEAEDSEDEDRYEAMISKYLDKDGRAQLGGLYQIKQGDTPLGVCREALFGSRDPVTSPVMRQAAIDLLVRIDCGPWNQVVYGVELSKLTSGHAQIDQYWTQRGVSFDPIYTDNFDRMSDGDAPSGAPGSKFAFIWIPMINLDKLDMEGIVTTEGMYHEDSEAGRGGSTIDPPPEVLALGFDDIIAGTAGCDLPEGDFRKTVAVS